MQDIKAVIDALRRRADQERAIALRERDPYMSGPHWGCNAGLNEAIVLLRRLDVIRTSSINKVS